MYDSLLAESKAEGYHAMPFITALHKGPLWVFWSIAGQLERSHSARRPVLLTLVWWSNFPPRPEQPNDPNTSADTGKELCVLCEESNDLVDLVSFWDLQTQQAMITNPRKHLRLSNTSFPWQPMLHTTLNSSHFVKAKYIVCEKMLHFVLQGPLPLTRNSIHQMAATFEKWSSECHALKRRCERVSWTWLPILMANGDAWFPHVENMCLSASVY